MKRKYLFTNEAQSWNKLVKKFLNLYKRIKKGDASEAFIQGLVNKLNRIYKRLEKMQYKVGIKLAGTTLALMLATTAVDAQSLSYAGRLKGNPASIYSGSRSSHTFADIDEDNDLDLYIANSDGNITIYKNDGMENFTMSGYMQADESYIDVGSNAIPTFADFDGDNDLDLFVGIGSRDIDKGKIKVFENNGNGVFTASGNLQSNGEDIITGNSFGSVDIFPVFADIDKDNDLDLYLGNDDGNVLIYKNDGKGHFVYEGKLTADGEEIDFNRAIPAFADLDNDGDLDLYVSNGSSISEFVNDGNGIFSNTSIQDDEVFLNISSSSSNLTFTDIDDDEDLDIFLTSYYGHIVVRKNDGNNNFSEAESLLAYGVDLYSASFPEFADIDNDGDLDLYSGSRGTYAYDSQIKVFENDGSGNFSEPGYLLSEGTDSIPIIGSNLEFADLDGDDDLDLFVGVKEGVINVYNNDGKGNFYSEGNFKADSIDVLNIEIDVGYFASPTFADIDNDGDLDLYVGNGDFGYNNGSFVHVYTNIGNGDFSYTGKLQADGIDISVGNEASPAFADIDKDGDLDLYVGSENDSINESNIQVFTNTGNGKFTSVGKLNADGVPIVGDWIINPAFADIDGDNDLDLYVGIGYGYIEVYINDGTTATKEGLANQAISIYPNPSEGIFNIVTDGPYMLSVYNLAGSLVKSIANKQNSGHYTLKLEDQAPGIYFIHFQNSQNIFIKKIVKR